MMIDHRNALAKGYEFHGYRIGGVLGHGGFGITYKARDLEHDRLVAIKEYLPAGFATRDPEHNSVHPSGPEDEEDFEWGLQRFEKEAQTLAAFHHPNIVEVYRYFEANNTAYLVMAYERGDALAAILVRDKTLPENEIREFLDPLMAGLERVHNAGFLHRDIKPENIYIRTDGSPVLIDFGSARQAIGARSQSLTSIVSGGYAPFEQYITDGHQEPSADIYALGATIYRAITGEKPPEATARIEDDPYEPAAQAAKDSYSAHLSSAVDSALAVDARDRPQSIGHFRDILKGRAAAPQPVHVRGEGDTEPPPGEKPRPRKPFPVRLVVIIAAAVITLAALAVGGYFVWQDQMMGGRAVEANRRRADVPKPSTLPRLTISSFRLRNRCTFPVKLLVYFKHPERGWITEGWIPVPPGAQSRPFKTKNRHVFYHAVSEDGRRVFNASNKNNPKKQLTWKGKRYILGHVNMGEKFVDWSQDAC